MPLGNMVKFSDLVERESTRKFMSHIYKDFPEMYPELYLLLKPPAQLDNKAL